MSDLERQFEHDMIETVYRTEERAIAARRLDQVGAAVPSGAVADSARGPAEP